MTRTTKWMEQKNENRPKSISAIQANAALHSNENSLKFTTVHCYSNAVPIVLNAISFYQLHLHLLSVVGPHLGAAFILFDLLAFFSIAKLISNIHYLLCVMFIVFIESVRTSNDFRENCILKLWSTNERRTSMTNFIPSVDRFRSNCANKQAIHFNNFIFHRIHRSADAIFSKYYSSQLFNKKKFNLFSFILCSIELLLLLL